MCSYSYFNMRAATEGAPYTCAYVAKVTSEVRDRIDAGRMPSPEQLANYVRQVVEQLQKLIKGAPRNIQDKMAEPWKGLYDFPEIGRAHV